MASGSSADVINLGDEGSQAQKLLQKHADHHATVEEAPEEDLKLDAPAADVSGGAAPSWAPTMSAKAAGKQTAQASSAALDTQSHELFPELGGPKPKANAAVPPVWSAKTTVNGKTNGAGSTNGTPRASTPASGVVTPTGSSRPAAPSMNIPGRNVETLFLDPQHVLPRAQLKRPIPDIIKDINRKSRANITMAPSANNRMKFEATGAQEIAQQALRDLVQQIGTKVGCPCMGFRQSHVVVVALTPRRSNRSRSRSPNPRGRTSLASRAPPSSPCRRRVGPRSSCPSSRMRRPVWTRTTTA